MHNIDPQPGEVYEGIDGGKMYIVARCRDIVEFTRRPTMDSYEPRIYRRRLRTFERMATMRLK